MRVWVGVGVGVWIGVGVGVLRVCRCKDMLACV